MSKSFKAPPTPTRAPVLSHAEVDAYVTKSAPPAPKPEKAPTARLSLDIPEDLHSRFKAACARSRVKMTAELLAFIERRTRELEETSK